MLAHPPWFRGADGFTGRRARQQVLWAREGFWAARRGAKEERLTPGASNLTFYAWLGRQVERTDDVGAFARYAVKDKLFPRQARKLVLFLLRYEGMPLQREGAKLAHREWRRGRREAA